jgi:hypothetical protein
MSPHLDFDQSQPSQYLFRQRRCLTKNIAKHTRLNQTKRRSFHADPDDNYPADKIVAAAPPLATEEVANQLSALRVNTAQHTGIHLPPLS